MALFSEQPEKAMTVSQLIAKLTEIQRVTGPNAPVVIRDADTKWLINVDRLAFSTGRDPQWVEIQGGYYDSGDEG
jgi:hypothetical protein